MEEEAQLPWDRENDEQLTRHGKNLQGPGLGAGMSSKREKQEYKSFSKWHVA